jgi:hypothetical protein
MSLDVYLTDKTRTAEPRSRIMVREGGSTRDVTREEWDRLQPGREPVVVVDPGDDGEVYSANITHNLGKMAREAGVYEVLWRPEEIGIRTAEQLVEPLTAGLDALKANPAHFKTLNPENGWGSYEGLVAFIADYIDAARANPQAEVYASR